MTCQLSEIIRTKLLGVHPDDQDVQLEDSDWRLILTALATPDQAVMAERETLESMVAWGDATFGPCTQARAITRASEEWQEMEEPGADVPIEAADVIICLLRIPGIVDAINRKMKINRGRNWNLQGDGTGYHVKDAAIRAQGEPK